MRTAILFMWVMILSSLVFIVFHTAYVIDNQNRRLNQLHLEIKEIEDDIGVLESEWSYLSRPERITALAEKHLAMGVPKARQVVSVSYISGLKKDGAVKVSYGE